MDTPVAVLLFVLGALTGAGLVGLVIGYLARDRIRRPPRE